MFNIIIIIITYKCISIFIFHTIGIKLYILFCHLLFFKHNSFQTPFLVSNYKFIFFKKERTKKKSDYIGYLLDSISLENKCHKPGPSPVDSHHTIQYC